MGQGGPSARNFTGQRYYDPGLGRFLSADNIVPGTAAGSGGGAASLGRDEAVALGPLTVDFHEPGFAAAVAAEHAFTLDNGFGFQPSARLDVDHFPAEPCQRPLGLRRPSDP